MIYDQANTPSLSQWLGVSMYLLAHLPQWVALFHASGGSNLRSSGSIYPLYSPCRAIVLYNCTGSFG